MNCLRLSNNRQPLSFPKVALILTVLLLGRPLLASPGSPDGVLNSFEGEIWINCAPVSGIDSGRVALPAGRGIRTAQGFAELLLTPGCFLRLASRSEFTLEQMRTAQVRARLVSGEALLEVLYLETPIILEQSGAIAIVRRSGLYDFNQRRAFISRDTESSRIPYEARSGQWALFLE
jgi:hypothetical protein